MKRFYTFTLGVCLSTASASYGATTCDVKSGMHTAALVELYTSEGCSSCPPADRELTRLSAQRPANARDSAIVIPLALHVSYWNSSAWKDRFAQPAFDARQGMLLAAGEQQVAYTPQFFLNGREVRQWSSVFPAAIARTNAIPAPLTIGLHTTQDSTTLLLEATVTSPDPRTAGALYLAVSESALVSQVQGGENSGARLEHDDTVRLWLGPFTLSQGATRIRQAVALQPAWRSNRLQTVAFVQSTEDAHILQALSTASCRAATPVRVW